MYSSALLGGAISSIQDHCDTEPLTNLPCDFTQTSPTTSLKKSFSWTQEQEEGYNISGFTILNHQRSQSFTSLSNYFLQAYSELGEKIQPALSATSHFSHKFIESAENLVKTKISLPVSGVIGSIAVGLEKLNMDLEENLVTLTQILEAYKYLKSCPDVVRTPTLMRVEDLFLKPSHSQLQTEMKHRDKTSISTENIQEDGSAQNVPDMKNVKLYLKMENMQTTGSFKIRGVMNQMRAMKQKHGRKSKLITMSAGNYGKAFAHCVGKSGNKAVCVMPDFAPVNRAQMIESMGVKVKRVPSAQLQKTVDDLAERDGYIFCHPFDDLDLIAGYASSTMELLEDVPDPDVVLVCCGGGGFVSGVAATISLSKIKGCRVYAVEPETAPTMYESFKARRPIAIPEAHSIAAGLSPPYTGTICYKHCRWFVEDVLTVSDEEVLSAMKTLFHRGIIAEPSGCAALAALLYGKVPDIQGKKVVVFVTGGNVSSAELGKLIPEGS